MKLKTANGEVLTQLNSATVPRRGGKVPRTPSQVLTTEEDEMGNTDKSVPVELMGESEDTTEHVALNEDTK